MIGRLLARATGLSERQARLIALLGLGAFGSAWAVTTITTYLPPLLRRYTSSNTLIGLVLAIESGFALLLPLAVGPWSDRVRTRFGSRRPFMLAGLFPLTAGLALVAFVPGLLPIALVLALFFVGVYLFESPYRGLYSDLLRRNVFGRSQGAQHVFRGVAIGGALVAGGFLLAVWRPLPFLVSAGIVAASFGVLLVEVHEPATRRGAAGGIRELLATPLRIVARNQAVRRYLIANSVWEGSFAGLRSFVVLDITRGLHQPSSVASLALACVAAGYLLAALGASRFGDRFGLARVIFAASLVYGAGLSLAVLAGRWHAWYYALTVFVAVAGGTVMTLGGGLLYKIMPGHDRGAVVGLATSSRAVGLLLGPLAVGGAIDVARPFLHATAGYAAMWPTIGIPILLVSPLLLLLARAEAA